MMAIYHTQGEQLPYKSDKGVQQKFQSPNNPTFLKISFYGCDPHEVHAIPNNKLAGINHWPHGNIEDSNSK